MKLCDKCPGYSRCCLNYLGSVCKFWRKKNAPDVVYTIADCIRDMSDEQLGIFLLEWAANFRALKEDGSGEVLAWLRKPAEAGDKE